MLMAVITPLTLAVEPEDFTLIGVVSHGKDRGKNAYINTRFVRENYKTLFSGEDYDSSLTLMQNEVMSSDSLKDSLSCWFDETCILTLSVEEVVSFNELYQMAKDPGLLNILATESYDEAISVAEKVMIDSLDVLVGMSRKDSGGN